MTRTYAAKRLLEHGPLTHAEFLEITGWPLRAVESALKSLVETGVATCNVFPGQRRSLYTLAI